MNHRLRTTLLFGLVLTLLSSAIAQTARKVAPVVSVKDSNVISAVSERATKEPSLKPEQLAAYGNELIASKGFDYDFDLCEMLNERDSAKSKSEVIVRNLQLSLTDGGKHPFRFTIGTGFEALCSECWSSIPSFQVTQKEMTLIAEGKQYRVKRPAAFDLDEAHLVDETLKKVLRTWQIPYQTVPTGISADGTKLYLGFHVENDLLDHLVLELSENGPPQFRDRAVMQSSEGESIDHPRDPNNGYLSFMRFRVGEKTYRVKYWGPCT